jgi:WD40 repeat protein
LLGSLCTLGLSRITQALFVPWRGEVAVATDSGSIQILDPQTLQVRRCFDGPADYGFEAVAVSSDGQLLAASSSVSVALGVLMGGSEAAVYLTDIETGSSERISNPKWGLIRSLAFSPAGDLLALGGSATYLWSIRTQTEAATLPSGPVGGRPEALAFSPDGSQLAVLSDSDEQVAIEIWDVAAQKRLRVLSTDEAFRFSFDYALALTSCGGRDVVIAACYEVVELWDTRTGEVIRLLPGTEGLALHPSGRWFAAAGSAWETSTGTLLRELPKTNGQPLSISSDGSLLLTEALALWGVDEECSGFVKVKDAHQGPREPVMAVSACTNGTLFVSCSQGGGSRLWQLQEPGIPPRLVPVSAPILTSVVGRDWDTENPHWRDVLSFRVSGVEGCSFPETPAWQLRLPTSPAGNVEMLPPSSEGEAIPIRPGVAALAWGTTAWVSAWAASPSGDALAVGLMAPSGRQPAPGAAMLAGMGIDGEIVLLDAVTRAERWRSGFHKGVVTVFAFGSDGDLVVSGSEDHSVAVWDAHTGALKRWLPTGSPVQSLCLDGTEQLLACGLKNGRILLWSIETGKLVCQFVGHSMQVNSLSFVPGTRLLLSGSADGTVKVWEVPGR